jgi:long-chain fatty acid transport protein
MLAASIFVGLMLAWAAPVWATNGMYLIGYGPEAIGRGGANLAISDRTLAINFNPAGIAQLQGNHLSASVSLLAPSLSFSNGLNPGGIDAEDRYFPLPAVTYVRAGKETPWSWGVGFVAQGGLGATFDGLNTPFGTRDQTYTQVRYGTITPTVAYAFDEDMAVGLSLNLGYADAAFRFFPDTSFFNAAAPQFSFPGVKMEDAAGLQTSARLGWWWRAHPKLSFGAVYQTETDSDFDGGELSVNYTGFPFIGQRVHYDAEMDGFTFAAQAGVGVAYRPTSQWVLALDVKRYFWDSAIDTILVTGTNPDVPLPAPFDRVQLPFVFDWEDQWVFAVGADYRLNDLVTLRGGYNYGENPVPDVTLTPLFPATVEHHLTFGVSWLRGSRVYELALEHAFNSSQTNDNLDPNVNPFGPGATVDHEQWTLSFGVSLAWARNGHS